ncbi:hypothetical protein BJV82DRAFT_597829 [Fennellomyces sp. T-0311]|nr:hypothetical protein BJV82DRAFT_597829 [Fennellomyces sp. T-0311]
MGKLQDGQYSSSRFTPRKKTEQPSRKSELRQRFCPPLDESLIDVIWNDSLNYDACAKILTELASEALEVEKSDPTPVHEEANDMESDEDEDYDNNDDELFQNVDFLAICFPMIARTTLANTLLDNDNDVEKTTDILLNDIFLESDTQQTEKKGKKSAKKKDKGVIWSSGQLPFAATREEVVEEYVTAPINAWTQYEGQVSDIRNAFPGAFQPIVLACVKKCRGNIIAAVRELMRKNTNLVPILRSTNLAEIEQIKINLADIITDRTPDEINHIATGVVIAECTKKPSPGVQKLTQMACDFALTFDREQRELAERLALLSLKNSADVPEMPAVPEYLLIDNQDTYTEEDPATCRQNAEELFMQRNELFRKAAAAYRQGKNKGPGEAGIAFYYSDEARQLDAQAKAWNLRAARAQVRSHRLREQNDHLVDLHGLTVSEAQVLVQEAVNQWWSRSQVQIGRVALQPLKIVTGIGSHSEYGEAKLLPSTIKLLKRGGWNIESSHPGCILVKGLSAKQQ